LSHDLYREPGGIIEPGSSAVVERSLFIYVILFILGDLCFFRVAFGRSVITGPLSGGFAPLTISLRPSSLLLHLITITIKNTITTQINQTLLTNRGIGGKDEITIVLAAEMGDQGWSGSWDTVGFHTHFLFQLLLFDGFVKGLRP